MKVLLFGGSGQLGFELIKRLTLLNVKTVAPVSSEVDISDKNQVKSLIKRTDPTVIFNAAAYTAVDAAETDFETALKVNKLGPENIGLAAKEKGIHVIHVSTDYVFDGTLERPLTESDATNPVNKYGESKLLGELALTEVAEEFATIVRTSSLHGERGINFVHTMLKLFKEKDEVAVVSDQIMSPTYAGWLAEVLIDLAKIKAIGLFHAASKGQLSWFEFASYIHEIAVNNYGDKIKAKLEKTTSDKFYRPAKRPHFSVLDTSKLEMTLGRSSITWKEGLHQHLQAIGIEVG